MIDEIFDRQHQAGRAQLNAAILSGAERLGHALGNAFAALNRAEYSAPWTEPAQRLRSR